MELDSLTLTLEAAGGAYLGVAEIALYEPTAGAVLPCLTEKLTNDRYCLDYEHVIGSPGIASLEVCAGLISSNCANPAKFDWRPSNGACHCATRGCPRMANCGCVPPSSGIAVNGMACGSGGQAFFCDRTPTNIDYSVESLPRDEALAPFFCETRVP